LRIRTGQSQRKDWLSDRGVDEKNWFQAHCSICAAIFQCRKQAITGHESSNSHKDKAAAWLKKQQARAGWQGQLNKGADYISVQPRQLTPSCTHSSLRVQDTACRGAPSLTCAPRGGSHALKYRFGEWVIVAELVMVMVMVPGSGG